MSSNYMPLNLTDVTGYDGLAAAVVFQAYKDLRKWLCHLFLLRFEIDKLHSRYLETEDEKLGSKIKAKETKYTNLKNASCDTVKFFRGEVFGTLCSLDSEAILERIFEEVRKENVQKGKRKKIPIKEINRENEKIHAIIRMGMEQGGDESRERQLDIYDKPSGVLKIGQHLSIYI